MASATGSWDREFDRVVKSFEAQAGVTPEELKCFKITTIDDLAASISSIEKKQAQGKTLAYLKRIEPFINTMLEFGKIVEVFLNVSDILAFVWGPLKLLLTLTSGFTNAFNALLEIYREISEQIPLLNSFKALFSEQEHMKKILLAIFEDILSFHLMALRYFRKKIWKELFIANWKGFTSEVARIKENLRWHKQLMESHASLSRTEDIRALRRETDERAKEAKEARTRQRREAVYQWLSPPNVETTYARHIKARLSNPDSCKWILGQSKFQSWFDPQYCLNPMLWINGVPGAGKSVLSSFIIEEAMKQADVSVGYFYFGYGDSTRNNFLHMTRSLLSQLLAQNDDLLDCYDASMLKNCAHGYLSRESVAKGLLEKALKCRKSYIILDGADECPQTEREAVCSWFYSIVDGLDKDNQDRTRCLFVSQDDGKKHLSMVPSLKITREHNGPDILAMARSSQAKIESKLGPCLLGRKQVQISDIVAARSRGMFIFARCVLEELEQYSSKRAIQNEWSVESFPEEVAEVYDRIYKRLIKNASPDRQKLSRRILSWVCQAKRPLRWFEIQAAISLNLDEESINESDGRLHDDCKDICASFVEILEDQTVELVHMTTRDFLCNPERNIVNSAKADLDMCLLSVSYLTFPEFSGSLSTAETRQALLDGRCAFQEYAISCWAFHLISGTSGCKQVDHEINGLVESLRETFDPFLAEHYTEGDKKTKVSKSILQNLKAFKDEDYFETLSEAVVWSRKQAMVDQTIGVRTGGNLDFPQVIEKIRSILEALAASDLQPEQRAKLELFYGRNLHKCPKLFCQFFFKGFSTKEHRDQHVNRHDRSYVYSFEGCPTATFGCVSQKDLGVHLLEIHGVRKLPDDFPNVPDPEATSSNGFRREQKDKSSFHCPTCPKNFTRAYNLRAHIRTHMDDKPFICTVCGKAFVRQSDRKRHEGQHTGEKKWVCGGDLEDGTRWGCGRGFTRGDMRAAHFRSEAGRLCTQPLDEEIKKMMRMEGTTPSNKAEGGLNL